MIGNRRKNTEWEDETWYKGLEDNQKCVADIIHKRHRYFSNHDRKFRIIVYSLKILMLFLSMLSTIILGIKIFGSEEIRISIGLVLSALTSFIAAIYSYFHLEEHWMRTVTIHIELNILRDEFICEASSKKLDNDRLTHYIKKIGSLQQNNIVYWTNARRMLETKKE